MPDRMKQILALMRFTNIDIYKKAKHTIYVIDDYVNIKTLHLLSHKKSGVHVILFTENGFGRAKDPLTASEVADFNKEYPTIQIKPKIRIDEELNQKLEVCMELEGKNKSEIIRESIISMYEELMNGEIK